MTAYKKLKIAILAAIASPSIYAITLEPIKIQSAPGELLYAEIKFSQSDTAIPIQVSLADVEDLLSIGTTAQNTSEHLNFYTRRNGAGEGVITITSTRPIVDSQLNFVIKIQEGNSTRLQNVKTSLQTTKKLPTLNQNERPLNPVIIRNDQMAALNLPESTQYNVQKNINTTGLPLKLNQGLPPTLSMKNSATNTSSVTIPEPAPTNTAIPLPLSTTQVKVEPPKPEATEPTQTKQTIATPKSEPAITVKKNVQHSEQANTQPTPTSPQNKHTESSAIQHTVKSNESLWSIASRIAAEQHKPINEVMKQIKAANQHAFIQGDANRLRQGVQLVINRSDLHDLNNKAEIIQTSKRSSKQSGKAKYQLNQAEMSLISTKTQDSAQSSADQRTQNHKISKELSLKVMTSRKKTVKLQRNVTQSELALNHKDHRIQLLNTRLAELQQQLKAQQVNKKPVH